MSDSSLSLKKLEARMQHLQKTKRESANPHAVEVSIANLQATINALTGRSKSSKDEE